MQGIIRYVWYVNKKIIITKIILQFLMMVIGYLLILLFNYIQITDSKLYLQINFLFVFIILFFSFDIYIQCYDNIRKTRCDIYISVTSIGLKRFNDCLVLFDLLFLLFSYFLCNIFLIFVHWYSNKSNLKKELSLLLTIFLFFLIAKLICIITIMLIRNVKNAIIIILIINILFVRFFKNNVEIQNIQSHQLIFFLVLASLSLVYIFIRSALVKLWKEEF